MKARISTGLAAATAIALLAAGCTYHSIETTSEVKPIHIVIDVNVKVDKDLDKFFGEAEKTALQQEVQQKAAQAASEATQSAVKRQEAEAAAKLPPTQAIPCSLEEAVKPVSAENAPVREAMMGRFAARLPQIKELKAKGIVGEDAKGFIQFVGEGKEGEQLIATENSDRKIVFERVAKRQGCTPEKAGQLKAERSAREALPGEYLQDASGKWSKKN
jgi:uncharacterized protein YdbL (DUF1318 family)